MPRLTAWQAPPQGRRGGAILSPPGTPRVLTLTPRGRGPTVQHRQPRGSWSFVVDWGLAKVVGRPEPFATEEEFTLRPVSATEATPTRTGAAIGTPQFMSPEQAQGRISELGPASDVYSLGATLYCLLTGFAPFHDCDTDSALEGAAQGAFTPPHELKANLPAGLETIGLALPPTSIHTAQCCLRCLLAAKCSRQQPSRLSSCTS